MLPQCMVAGCGLRKFLSCEELARSKHKREEWHQEFAALDTCLKREREISYIKSSQKYWTTTYEMDGACRPRGWPAPRFTVSRAPLPSQLSASRPQSNLLRTRQAETGSASTHWALSKAWLLLAALWNCLKKSLTCSAICRHRKRSGRLQIELGLRGRPGKR